MGLASARRGKTSGGAGPIDYFLENIHIRLSSPRGDERLFAFSLIGLIILARKIFHAEKGNFTFGVRSANLIKNPKNIGSPLRWKAVHGFFEYP